MGGVKGPTGQARPGPAESEKATILVVDDTPANLTLLTEILKPDYRTRVAVSGEKALRLAASGSPPDLILLDVMMPGIDGYEVCRRLKLDAATRDIPVIFVTSMGEVENETRGLEVGGIDYLTKPINAAIVRARVRTHLLLRAQTAAMQKMVAALETQAAELAELNRTLETRVASGVEQLERLGRLKRFFSPSVVDMLLAGASEDPLQSHRREVAAVFLDLRGYTAFTEMADPEEVMAVISEYHSAMGAIVMDHGGTIERFAGDGIMVFFNDPVPVDNPSLQGASMALAMQRRFATCARAWQARGYELAMGIGIALGYATIGAIGFDGRRDYGVIGTVTNLAARLCAEALGGQILVSQRVHSCVSKVLRTERVGELQLKGFHRPVAAYSVLGHHVVAADEASGEAVAPGQADPAMIGERG